MSLATTPPVRVSMTDIDVGAIAVARADEAIFGVRGQIDRKLVCARLHRRDLINEARWRPCRQQIAVGS